MKKNNTKILLTVILKDDSEIDMATRMLESFMPHMDGLCVAITGTSGKNKKLRSLINKHGGRYVVTSPKTNPEIYTEGKFSNFAAARNASFALAEKMQKENKYDWWTWADVDDVLIAGEEVRMVAEKALASKVDSVFFTYWYSVILDENGDIREVSIEHLRERLLKPGIFKWVSRLHEVAVSSDDNYKPKHTMYEFDSKAGQNAVWCHLTNDDRIMDACKRNVKILEEQIKEENRKDPRTLFYLAKTYFDLNEKTYDQLALALLDEYLEMSGWAEERANALEYMADIYLRFGDTRKAVETLHEAIKEYPIRHMLYLKLAREYYALDLEEQANHWLDVALKLPAPSARTTIGNPAQVKMFAAGLKYNYAIKHGKIDDAIYWLKIRDKIAGIKDNKMLEELEDAKLLNQAGIWLFNYCKWLKEKGHENLIPSLLKAVPIDLGREPFVHHIANEYKKPRKHGEKEIVYYASGGGEAFEQWSPESIKRGVGGSERAVIELARQWAKDGYKVTVYGDPREDVGVYEGVEYKPWYEINWKDEFNIIIFWRAPWMLDRDIKANKIFMDLHDVASQPDWTDERMEKVDKVFFKSEYHRNQVPKLPDGKAVVVSNGI